MWLWINCYYCKDSQTLGTAGEVPVTGGQKCPQTLSLRHEGDDKNDGFKITGIFVFFQSLHHLTCFRRIFWFYIKYILVVLAIALSRGTRYIMDKQDKMFCLLDSLQLLPPGYLGNINQPTWLARHSPSDMHSTLGGGEINCHAIEFAPQIYHFNNPINIINTQRKYFRCIFTVDLWTESIK